MGESLLALTIITLVILTIRRARPVVLESPVTINRPGKYQIILAPQLNRAHTFIEQIAKPYMLLHPPEADLPTLYYEIRDPLVFAKGENSYLLAITLRGGLLYFQAVNPESSEADAQSRIDTLREFALPVLEQHPLSKPAGEQWSAKLRDMVAKIAGEMKINAKELQAVA